MKITDHIKLDDFNILEVVKMPFFNWTPISEKHVSRSQGDIKKIVKLSFKQGNYKTGVKLSIEKLENNIFLSLSIESVCKNTMLPDKIMDGFIVEISEIANSIRQYIKERYTIDSISDPFLIRELDKYYELYNKKNLLRSVEELIEMVSLSEPQKLNYANNVENVILFGTLGHNLAEIYVENNIADYTHEYGGYVLRFHEKKYQILKDFPNILAYNLSRMGFSSKVYPLALIENYWIE